MIEPALHEAGFLPISRLFLTNYRKMNISMEEAMLILHLLDHSWSAEREFPSAEHFAKVTGKSGQTIRAYLRSLSYKRYLTPVRNEAGEKTYCWKPLLGALKDLAGAPQDPVQTDEPKSAEPKSELERIVEAANALSADANKKRTPAQTSPKQYQRIRKFQEKTPDQYNAKDMEFVLAMKWKEKWNSPPPRFYGRDMKHAKSLIEIYTAETVSQVIVWSLDNWELLCDKYNIKGYPSMPIFWGFRNSIFPLYIDGELNTSAPSWGSHFNQEDTRPEGSELGWG